MCRELWKYQRLIYHMCQMGGNQYPYVKCILEPITYNNLVKEEDERLKQKDFVLEMVDKRLEILTTLNYSSTISAHEKTSESLCAI